MLRTQLAPILTLVVVAFAAAALALAGPGAGREAHAPTTLVAEAATTDFRTVLTATRTGRGAAPTASVMATSFRRVAGRWAETTSRELPGTYFWHTLAGPRAVCRLEIRTAGPGARFRPRAVVQLLAGPSLGCGRARAYPLTR